MRPRLLLSLVLPAACTPATEPATETPGDDTAEREGRGGARITAAPLEAVYGVLAVRWTMEAPGTARVEHRMVGMSLWQQAPARDLPAGEAELLVAGWPLGAEVEYRVVLDSGEILDGPRPAALGEPPAGMPMPEILVSTDGWDPGARYLLSSIHEDERDWGERWWLFAIDRLTNQVVWAHLSEEDGELPWVSRHVTMAPGGHALLVDRATAWARFDGGWASTVVEMTLDGTVHQTHKTPGLHHPFAPMPDGGLAWTARPSQDDLEEVVEVLDAAGQQRRLWSCGEGGIAPSYPGAPCGTNTIWYDDARDRLLVSFWSHDSILELDAQTGGGDPPARPRRRRLGLLTGGVRLLVAARAAVHPRGDPAPLHPRQRR